MSNPVEAASEAHAATVRTQVTEHPDWTLRQHAEQWGVSASTVLEWFRRAGVVQASPDVRWIVEADDE